MNLRFSLTSLFALTTVVGVAFATIQAADVGGLGWIVHEIVRLTFVLLSSAALTAGLLSSGRVQVFCLTWGVFFITQQLLNSCPSFVQEIMDYQRNHPSEWSGRVINSSPYVHMVTGIWFDVVVATVSGYVALMISTTRRLDKLGNHSTRQSEILENG